MRMLPRHSRLRRFKSMVWLAMRGRLSKRQLCRLQAGVPSVNGHKKAAAIALVEQCNGRASCRQRGDEEADTAGVNGHRADLAAVKLNGCAPCRQGADEHADKAEDRGRLPPAGRIKMDVRANTQKVSDADIATGEQPPLAKRKRLGVHVSDQIARGAEAANGAQPPPAKRKRMDVHAGDSNGPGEPDLAKRKKVDVHASDQDGSGTKVLTGVESPAAKRRVGVNASDENGLGGDQTIPDIDILAVPSPSKAVTNPKKLRKQLQLRIEDDPYGDCPAPITSFGDIDCFPAYVVENLRRHGIASPLPIQSQALPLVLMGRDVIGLAQTGSGKTLAFLLPAAVRLQARLAKLDAGARKTTGLVLAPTRELAVQIFDEAEKFLDTAGSSQKLARMKSACLYGGGDKWKQRKQLHGGVDIIIATPGRLRDFMESEFVALGRVNYFVLDEADRMLDMGFSEDVDAIAKTLDPKRQMLFFSATWSQDVQQLAQGLCRKGSKPVRVSYGQSGCNDAEGREIEKRQAREGITQQVVVVDHTGPDKWESQAAEKRKLLNAHVTQALQASEEHKVLIFVSQKTLADDLSRQLCKDGFKADSMHGGKSQDYRLWVLDQFRQGHLRVLVCTDVLGRGIDIPSVSHVVVHEMGEIEDYIHRIGRTARGKYGKGHAFVFFEYWPGYPDIAAELVEVLEASKQKVPEDLRRIAEEVRTGKRAVQLHGSRRKSRA